MTAITVVRKNGYTAIASDTLSKWGSAKESADYIVNHEKIIVVKENYLALAGSTSGKLMLRDYFRKYEGKVDLGDVDSIFRTWLTLHHSLKETYYLDPDDEAGDAVESSRVEVLIANPYGIFGVEPHRTVQEFSRFYAFGSGNPYAMGAMYALYDDPHLSAEEVARRGVAAAAEFDDATGLPILSHAMPLQERPSVSEPPEKTKGKKGQG